MGFEKLTEDATGEARRLTDVQRLEAYRTILDAVIRRWISKLRKLEENGLPIEIELSVEEIGILVRLIEFLEERVGSRPDYQGAIDTFSVLLYGPSPEDN